MVTKIHGPYVESVGSLDVFPDCFLIKRVISAGFGIMAYLAVRPFESVIEVLKKTFSPD